MSKVVKIILIIVIIGVLGAIGYLMLSGDGAAVGTPTTGSPLQTSTGQPVSGLNATATSPQIDADQISQEFLNQLLNIRAIKLKDDVFSSPTFVSLIDFTIQLIQPGNEGRINPFAPFGIDEESMLSPEFTIDGGFQNGIQGGDPNTNPNTNINNPQPSGGAGFVVPITVPPGNGTSQNQQLNS